MSTPFPSGTDDIRVGDAVARPVANGSFFVFRGDEPHLGTLGLVHPVGRSPSGPLWWVAMYLQHDPISVEDAVVTPLPVLMDRDLEPPIAGWGRSIEEAAAHLVRPR